MKYHVTASWWVEDPKITTKQEAIDAVENAVGGSTIDDVELDDSECDEEEEGDAEVSLDTPMGLDAE